MAGRIGITTNPARRRAEWASLYPGMHNWQILEVHGSKSAAQRREHILAAQYGYYSAAGGDGQERDTWYVYMFRY